MKYIVIVTAFCSLFVNTSKSQTSAADNKPSQTITFHSIPKGPSVFGNFEGRFPCFEVARQLKIETTADCVKFKWSLTLYQDPVTFQPITFTLSIVGGGDIVKLEGSSYRQKLCAGKWAIIKGLKSNPDADVYQLEFNQPVIYFYFLKGDENVLFVLNENKEFRVGNENFSYTLNRVELVAKNK